MRTRLVNTAADVIHRAQANGHVTAAGIAVALESAQLLQPPQRAAELADLQARRDVLLAMLPTEPCTERGLPNDLDAARAAYGVWEQVAGVLGVTLPHSPAATLLIEHARPTAGPLGFTVTERGEHP
ncbi:hypothetical protein [Streptomyces sp. NPDC059063]|uniref:hypothetical protein n=1 Tax=unclassified Streptomyces TaxID=2593676 RepID=UPI0036A05156